MTPEESIRAGHLAQALQDLQLRVRANPSDAKERVFLFQLLALLGQWERAATQLRVAGDLDPGTLILVQIYRQAIASELLRARIFSGRSTPLLFGEPAHWIAALLEALRLSGEGHYQKAAELREQALQEAPAISGSINGERFEWLADADSRLGPCLEIIIDGKYMWAPCERIHALRMQAPSDLRDLVWTQAIVTWTNAGQSPVLIPVRYSGTENSADETLKLSRRTDWESHPADTYVGLGQRMLATDTGEYPLLEIREILFDTPRIEG